MEYMGVEVLSPTCSQSENEKKSPSVELLDC